MIHTSGQHEAAVQRLDAHAVRRVAVAALCDPKSVLKFLAGGRLRPTVALRVRRALKRLGLNVGRA